MDLRGLVEFAALGVAFLGIATAGAAPIGPHTLALAAGYKAAFLCGGLFDAGQPRAAIEADDLEGIYPELQAPVRSLEAVVDPRARTVSVAFDPRLPPRMAAWRPSLGCAQLPIGAGAAAVAALPKLGLAPPGPLRLDRPWPAGEAASAPPSVGLGAVLARAFDQTTYGKGSRTTAVLVVAAGRIVGERYREGYDRFTPQRTWSAAKSLTSALIGRAVRLGLVRLDERPNIPEWAAPGDPRAAIGWRQLMSMSSGLYTNGAGNRTDEIYLGGGAVDQVATAMPLETAPGTRFHYANDDVLIAARALRATLGDGQRALGFPFTELLWKIGMDHTTLETDWRGNYILSSQVWTTSRDLARLGELFLDDGVWNGQRLLPEGWSRFVATPAAAQPDTASAGAPGYGALFWLFGPRQGLPEGTYAMLGNRGQYVLIIPAKGVIVVRRGFDAAAGAQFDAAAFARDVLAKL